MAAKTKDEAKVPALTEYIVLQAVVIEDDRRPTVLKSTAHREVWVPVLNAKASQGADGIPRVFLAASKAKAIRAHTGDGSGIVEGTWRAIPLSSWRGGHQTRRVQAAERLPIDD